MIASLTVSQLFYLVVLFEFKTSNPTRQKDLTLYMGGTPVDPWISVGSAVLFWHSSDRRLILESSYLWLEQPNEVGANRRCHNRLGIG